MTNAARDRSARCSADLLMRGPAVAMVDRRARRVVATLQKVLRSGLRNA